MKIFSYGFLSLALLSGPALAAIDCQSNCDAIANVHPYPCPTPSNPFKTCYARDPGIYASCEISKRTSCELWSQAADFVVDRMRGDYIINSRFNAHMWQVAIDHGITDHYMTGCVGAVTTLCATLGAQLGGPWGAAISGAMGLFAAERTCEQSKSW